MSNRRDQSSKSGRSSSRDVPQPSSARSSSRRPSFRSHQPFEEARRLSSRGESARARAAFDHDARTLFPEDSVSSVGFQPRLPVPPRAPTPPPAVDDDDVFLSQRMPGLYVSGRGGSSGRAPPSSAPGHTFPREPPRQSRPPLSKSSQYNNYNDYNYNYRPGESSSSSRRSDASSSTIRPGSQGSNRRPSEHSHHSRTPSSYSSSSGLNPYGHYPGASHGTGMPSYSGAGTQQRPSSSSASSSFPNEYRGPSYNMAQPSSSGASNFSSAYTGDYYSRGGPTTSGVDRTTSYTGNMGSAGYRTSDANHGYSTPSGLDRSRSARPRDNYGGGGEPAVGHRSSHRHRNHSSDRNRSLDRDSSAPHRFTPSPSHYTATTTTTTTNSSSRRRPSTRDGSTSHRQQPRSSSRSHAAPFDGTGYDDHDDGHATARRRLSPVRTSRFVEHLDYEHTAHPIDPSLVGVEREEDDARGRSRPGTAAAASNVSSSGGAGRSEHQGPSRHIRRALDIIAPWRDEARSRRSSGEPSEHRRRNR